MNDRTAALEAAYERACLKVQARIAARAAVKDYPLDIQREALIEAWLDVDHELNGLNLPPRRDPIPPLPLSPPPPAVEKSATDPEPPPRKAESPPSKRPSSEQWRTARRTAPSSWRSPARTRTASGPASTPVQDAIRVALADGPKSCSAIAGLLKRTVPATRAMLDYMTERGTLIRGYDEVRARTCWALPGTALPEIGKTPDVSLVPPKNPEENARGEIAVKAAETPAHPVSPGRLAPPQFNPFERKRPKKAVIEEPTKPSVAIPDWMVKPLSPPGRRAA